ARQALIKFAEIYKICHCLRLANRQFAAMHLALWNATAASWVAACRKSVLFPGEQRTSRTTAMLPRLARVVADWGAVWLPWFIFNPRGGDERRAGRRPARA